MSSNPILESFNGPPMPKAKPALGYRVALSIVAVAMIALPLIYIGIIVGVGYGVRWHILNNTHIIENRWGLVFYAGITLAGIIALIFMIKPLFARRAKQAEPVKIDRESEPVLFETVEKICTIVGSPTPRDIVVNTEVNASASLRRGFLSIFTNDLRLTIGLPLARGLNMNQLAEVLAHEFGHFAQAGGMRMLYIIRSINFWFARVVYERDAWDEKLKDLNSSLGDFWAIAIIIGMARAMVWLIRKILWVFMQIGHFISCFALRQMEYDADRCAAYVVGSHVFRQTSDKMRNLGIASQTATGLLSEMWNDQRLAADYPWLIARQVRKLPEDAVEEYRKAAWQEPTGRWDTHPSDKDRAAAVEALNHPGVFHSELPAENLFFQLDNWSQLATRHFYLDEAELDLSRCTLLPNEELRLHARALELEKDAEQDLFQGCSTIFIPVAPTVAGVSGHMANPEFALHTYHNTGDELKAAAEQTLQKIEGFGNGLEQHSAATIARKISTAGFPLEAGAFGFQKVDAISLQQEMHSANQFVESSKAEIEPFLNKAIYRLEAGLAHAYSKMNEAEQHEANLLLDTASKFPDYLNRLIPIRDELNFLTTLLQGFDGEMSQQQYNSVTQAQTTLGTTITHFKALLAQTAYPFDHNEGNINLATYTEVKHDPTTQPIVRVITDADALNDKLVNLYYRVLGRLAAIAMTHDPTREESE